MKITVNRKLESGTYFVSFKVGDFTPDELQKMQSFGVPNVKMKAGLPYQRTLHASPLTAISEGIRAGFKSEEEAKAYENEVLNQIREAMKSLRESQDDFTSSQEVNL